jgi:hypothetical protein
MTKLLLLLQDYVIPIIIGDCINKRKCKLYALPTTHKTKTAEVTEE